MFEPKATASHSDSTGPIAEVSIRQARVWSAPEIGHQSSMSRRPVQGHSWQLCYSRRSILRRAFLMFSLERPNRLASVVRHSAVRYAPAATKFRTSAK